MAATNTPTKASLRGDLGAEPVLVLKIKGDLAYVRDRANRDFWVQKRILSLPGAAARQREQQKKTPMMF